MVRFGCGPGFDVEANLCDVVNAGEGVEQKVNVGFAAQLKKQSFVAQRFSAKGRRWVHTGFGKGQLGQRKRELSGRQVTVCVCC